MNLQISLLIVAITALTANAYKSNYDVCIIGGGAGGVSTGIFSKEMGLSVVIIEKEVRLGGHCDTEYFSVPLDAPSDTPNWVDLGVVAFPDTIKANVDLDGNTYGRWEDFDMKAFMENIAGEGSIVPTNIGGGTRHAFLEGMGFIDPAMMPSQYSYQQIGAAMANLTAVFVEYPWIETGVPPQGPVPEELLGPFSAFIVEKGLQPLLPFFQGSIYIGGMGSWDTLTTLWALRQVSPTDIRSFTTPNSHFSLKGGCQSFYNGAMDHLGSSNILLQSTVTKVTRPSAGNITVNIKGTSSQNNGTAVLNCGKLVIAIAQTPSNINFIDLDSEEIPVFSSVSTRSYFAGAVDLEGPVSGVDNKSTYTILHLDPFRQPNMLVQGPTWAALAKFTTYAPTALYAFAENYMSEADMEPILDTQFSQLQTAPNSIITGHHIHHVHRHDYQPYPSNSALNSSTNFFEKVASLQGHRKTYWVGALIAMSSHNTIFFHTRKLVRSQFVTSQTVTAAAMHDEISNNESIQQSPVMFILGGAALVIFAALVLAGLYQHNKTKKISSSLPFSVSQEQHEEKEIRLVAVSEVPC